MTDEIQRFSFTTLPVRGQFVRLNDAWRAATKRQNYELPTAQLVGEFMALAALLADGIKFDGRVALQATGNGRIGTLLGECNARHQLRGIARMNEIVTPGAPGDLGDGRLAISLIPERGSMHQGVVELVGGKPGPAIEHYFERSEQLPTRVKLATSADSIVAVLLQRLPLSLPPGADEPTPAATRELEDTWERLQMLFDTCTTEELLSLQPQQMLHRLFHTETLTLHPPRILEFHCTCSRERSEAALKLLGKDDLTALSNEADEITVSCEMCGIEYRWNSIEAHVLFETHDPQIH